MLGSTLTSYIPIQHVCIKLILLQSMITQSANKNRRNSDIAAYCFAQKFAAWKWLTLRNLCRNDFLPVLRCWRKNGIIPNDCWKTILLLSIFCGLCVIFDFYPEIDGKADGILAILNSNLIFFVISCCIEGIVFSSNHNFVKIVLAVGFGILEKRAMYLLCLYLCTYFRRFAQH